MNLRRLNAEGIAAFTAYLVQLKVEPSLQPPFFLLTEATTSEPLADVLVPNCAFATRFEAAAALDSLFTSAALSSPESDVGLGTWLTLFYFDQVCPVKQGEREVYEHARYIPETHNYQRFYRHLLIGPFLIYRAHIDEPKRSFGVLATPLNSPGEIAGQFAAYQKLRTNRAVIGAVTALYVDQATSRLKRGASGKAAGSPRRLADVLNQFDVTYDLYAMSVSNLVALLPREFDRFKPV